MFADQHLESLGGAQVSMRLQKRFLERAGHVSRSSRRARTARAPATRPTSTFRRSRSPPTASTPSPGRASGRIDSWMPRWCATSRRRRARAGGLLGGVHRPPVRRAPTMPVVHTMHNRVDVGIEATAPFPGSCCGRSTPGRGGAARGAAARAGVRGRAVDSGTSPRVPAKARVRRADRPTVGVPASAGPTLAGGHGALEPLRPPPRGARRRRGRRRDLERHRRRRARRRPECRGVGTPTGRRVSSGSDA